MHVCAHPEQTTPRARKRKLRGEWVCSWRWRSGPLPVRPTPGSCKAGRRCYAVAGRVTCCYCDGSSHVQVKVAVWGLAWRQQQSSFDESDHQRPVIRIRDRSEIPSGTRASARARAHSHRPMRAHMHARARAMLARRAISLQCLLAEPRRQWPEVSDFVACFCTLRESKNTVMRESCKTL